ncbi:MAG TPA: nucleotidyltransferase domain-containing protein [Thermoanaerobaculia bacterium]|jgi:predicted nucleotidyltransferase|nr:nucleotidyltransferase domain-containing protein [Thermoanaerobaculia bacterium]
MEHLPPTLQEAVRKLEAGLRNLYGERFRGLLLYGSYARGDAREGSDVDLLLLLEGPVNSFREVLRMEPVTWPLSLEYDTVLSVTPMSLDSFERQDSLFLRTLQQDVVPAS